MCFISSYLSNCIVLCIFRLATHSKVTCAKRCRIGLKVFVTYLQLYLEFMHISFRALGHSLDRVHSRSDRSYQQERWTDRSCKIVIWSVGDVWLWCIVWLSKTRKAIAHRTAASPRRLCASTSCGCKIEFSPPGCTAGWSKAYR
jgi:hypothetical protein